MKVARLFTVNIRFLTLEGETVTVVVLNRASFSHHEKSLDNEPEMFPLCL